MEESKAPERKLLYIVLAVVGVLVLMRIPVFGRILLFYAALALVGALIYGLVFWVRKWRRNAAEKAFQRTREGRIRQKAQECHRLMERNQAEMKEIKNNLDELEEQLALPDISAKQREETLELKNAFHSEWDLRQAKAQFFDSCSRKLAQLEQHFRLERELASKKDSLRRLQEKQYEELADYEGIKSELELNVYYLETIDELSTRMISSTSVSDAQHLQLELEEMTRDLNDA